MNFKSKIREMVKQAMQEILDEELAEEKNLDPVGQEDADVDNDGDVDASDDYLKNRRDTIGKAMKRKGEYDEPEEMDETIASLKTQLQSQTEEQGGDMEELMMQIVNDGELYQKMQPAIKKLKRLKQANQLTPELAAKEFLLFAKMGLKKFGGNPNLAPALAKQMAAYYQDEVDYQPQMEEACGDKHKKKKMEEQKCPKCDCDPCECEKEEMKESKTWEEKFDENRFAPAYRSINSKHKERLFETLVEKWIKKGK